MNCGQNMCLPGSQNHSNKCIITCRYFTETKYWFLYRCTKPRHQLGKLYWLQFYYLSPMLHGGKSISSSIKCISHNPICKDKLDPELVLTTYDYRFIYIAILALWIYVCTYVYDMILWSYLHNVWLRILITLNFCKCLIF